MHVEDASKGYDKKALEIFERKQGRVFLEEIGKSGARDFSGLPRAVKDNETDLENRMDKVQAAMVAELPKVQIIWTRRVSTLEAGMQQFRAAYRALQEEIRIKCPTTMP